MISPIPVRLPVVPVGGGTSFGVVVVGNRGDLYSSVLGHQGIGVEGAEVDKFEWTIRRPLAEGNTCVVY